MSSSSCPLEFSQLVSIVLNGLLSFFICGGSYSCQYLQIPFASSLQHHLSSLFIVCLSWLVLITLETKPFTNLSSFIFCIIWYCSIYFHIFSCFWVPWPNHWWFYCLHFLCKIYQWHTDTSLQGLVIFLVLWTMCKTGHHFQSTGWSYRYVIVIQSDQERNSELS